MNLKKWNKEMFLIFDLDDTLYDLADPFYRAHEDVIPKHWELDSRELFKKSRVHADEILHKEKEGLIPREETLYLRIERTYKDFGVMLDRKTVDLFQEKYRYYQKHISLPENVRKLLNLCREWKIPMYILSNGKSDEQRNKAKALGLDEWFDEQSIFVTEELGYLKPHIQAFRGVENALKVSSEQIWYVGDTYDADVLGSKNAGWKVIWYNHRKRKVEENIADLTVETVEELILAVEKLRKNHGENCE